MTYRENETAEPRRVTWSDRIERQWENGSIQGTAALLSLAALIVVAIGAAVSSCRDNRCAYAEQCATVCTRRGYDVLVAEPPGPGDGVCTCIDAHGILATYRGTSFRPAEAP